MGAGKSSIGYLLAKKLKFKHCDIDKVIENKTKMKIVQIFKEKGESYFRNLEEKSALQVLNKNNHIISLGGGGFLNENIREEIKKKSISIWLDWKHKTLINRINLNKKKRPIALNLTNNKIRDLIIKRSKIYSKANYKINCENKDKDLLTKEIIQIYENI